MSDAPLYPALKTTVELLFYFLWLVCVAIYMVFKECLEFLKNVILLNPDVADPEYSFVF